MTFEVVMLEIFMEKPAINDIFDQLQPSILRILEIFEPSDLYIGYGLIKYYKPDVETAISNTYGTKNIKISRILSQGHNNEKLNCDF